MNLKDIAFVQDIGRKSYERINKVRWSKDKLRATYANRSGRRIAVDGDTFYMGTCPDLTMMAAFIAEQRGEPYEIAIEMHQAHNGFPLNRPHLAIEFPRRNLHLNFRRLNEIEVGPGNYSASSEHSEIISRIPQGEFSAEATLHENLGYRTREGMNALFSGLLIERLIEKMATDHTEDNYAKYKVMVPLDIPAIITCIP